MKSLSDLDYFRAQDGIVYLVKGPYHKVDAVFAYPVFWPDVDGDRVHPQWGSYRKDVSDIDNTKLFKLHPTYRHAGIPQATPLVPHSAIDTAFSPRQRAKSFSKISSYSVWSELFNIIHHELGIALSDIGIFGSHLVGLSQNTRAELIKDIDFVIYGLQNLALIKDHIDDIHHQLGATPISAQHIQYHSWKFGRFFDPHVNSFPLTLANKWSSIQIKPRLLSTLRFAYRPDELPTNPISSPAVGHIQVRGVVEDDNGTNFLPRVFILKSLQKLYKVVTYYWCFQAAVKNGQTVMVTGQLHADGATISIDSTAHGIKILA